MRGVCLLDYSREYHVVCTIIDPDKRDFDKVLMEALKDDFGDAEISFPSVDTSELHATMSIPFKVTVDGYVNEMYLENAWIY